MAADSIAQFRGIFPDVSEQRSRELIEACTGNVQQAIELFLAQNAQAAKAEASTADSAAVDDEDEAMILPDKPASGAAAAGRKRKGAASSPKPAAPAAAAASPLSSPSKRAKHKPALTPSKHDKQHSLASFWNKSPVAAAAAFGAAEPAPTKAAPSKLTAAMRSQSRMDEAARESPAATAAAASSSSYTAAASDSSAAAAVASPADPSHIHSAVGGGLSSFFSVAPSSSASAASCTVTDSSDPLRPCWPPRSPVPFVFLARIFSLIEGENGRIKITNWLTYAFWQILAFTPADLPAALFLSSDQLAPSYLNHQLGVGGSTLVKLVSEMTGVPTSKLSADHARLGDLGLIAAQYRMSQQLLFRPAPLSIAQVFASFHSLGEISKRDKKEALLKKLFAAARESEFLYLIRIAEGGLRIGAVVTTVLSALAKAFTLHHLYCEGVPEERRHEVCTFDRALKATEAVKAATKAGVQPFQLKPPPPDATPSELASSISRRLPSHLAQATAKLRRAYAELPSFHDIIPVLMRSPTAIYELHKHIQLTAGIPIKPQLGRPMQSVMQMLKLFRGLPFTIEVKYDGLRAQIHRLPSGAYRIFSRHLMDQRDRWDDLVPHIDAARKPSEGDKPEATSFIIDAEIVAIEHISPPTRADDSAASSSSAATVAAAASYRILPFQQLSTRRRKGDSLQANGEKRTEVSCMVYVFDFLSLNGQSLLLRSLPERRALMAQTFEQREGQFQFVEHVDIPAAATRDLDFEELEEEEAAKGKSKAAQAKANGKGAKKAAAAAASTADDDEDAAEGSSDDDVEEIKRDAADDEEAVLMRMASTGAAEESKEPDAAVSSSAAAAAGVAASDSSNSASTASAGTSASAASSSSSAAAASSSVTDIITAFLNSTAIPRGEGLMCKSLAPGSTYEPDVRTDQWCKLKKDFISGMGVADSIDVVVIGAWHGNGRKAGWFSPFLVAVYNPDTEEYESFAKVMSGFSDAVYKQFTAECQELIIPQPRKYYRVAPGMTPTLWFKPVKVWEIRGADLTISPIHQAACGLVHESRGISLRFPRFIRARDDKAIDQATTSDEIARMYRGQSIVQQPRQFAK